MHQVWVNGTSPEVWILPRLPCQLLAGGIYVESAKYILLGSVRKVW
jgi:hypothetical protein